MGAAAATCSALMWCAAAAATTRGLTTTMARTAWECIGATTGADVPTTVGTIRTGITPRTTDGLITRGYRRFTTAGDGAEHPGTATTEHTSSRIRSILRPLSG